MTSPLEGAALARFDEENAKDPEKIELDGILVARELALAHKLTAWVYRLEPHPSLALRLATRCQHLRRFEIPRGSYPSGREGYLTWRRDLSKFHADEAEKILTELGFDLETRATVRRIQRKQGLKLDRDVQIMEDALCLSFLENEFVPFMEGYEDEKVIDIVQKTWRKMSPQGQKLALTLPLFGRAEYLIKTALAGLA